MTCWIGVDVGGERKGFDVAVVDRERLLGLHARLTVAGVAALVAGWRPAVVGIDSPRAYADADGARRPSELRVMREVCRIRWTPTEEAARGDPFYGWIIRGRALFDALASSPAELIEVFPTASFTRWAGVRGSRRRAGWTTDALGLLGLAGVPARTNQDQRDAIAAAVTAREHADGRSERLGDIVVPPAPGRRDPR